MLRRPLHLHISVTVIIVIVVISSCARSKALWKLVSKLPDLCQLVIQFQKLDETSSPLSQQTVILLSLFGHVVCPWEPRVRQLMLLKHHEEFGRPLISLPNLETAVTAEHLKLFIGDG